MRSLSNPPIPRDEGSGVRVDPVKACGTVEDSCLETIVFRQLTGTGDGWLTPVPRWPPGGASVPSIAR